MRKTRRHLAGALVTSALVGILALSQPALGSVDRNLRAAPATARAVSDTAPVVLMAASCSTSLRCIAVGGMSVPEIYRTSDGGTTWTSTTSTSATRGLSAVSCSSASRCLAMGAPAVIANPYNVFIKTVDGGTAWTAIPQTTAPAAPTCVTARTCVDDLGGALYESVKGWTNWDPISLRGWSYIDDLACVSDTTCFVVGYKVNNPHLEFGEFSIGGTQIRRIASMPFAYSYTPQLSIACPSARSCMVAIEQVDGPERILVTSDAGLRWTARSLPASLGESTVLDCNDPGHCVLAGGTDPVATTTNDGRSWLAHTPAPFATSPYGWGVSCHFAAACIVVWGETVFVGSGNLRTWRPILVS
jgi:photosystem II stability/assembly factor-like uncharacterized protein